MLTTYKKKQCHFIIVCSLSAFYVTVNKVLSLVSAGGVRRLVPPDRLRSKGVARTTEVSPNCEVRIMFEFTLKCKCNRINLFILV